MEEKKFCTFKNLFCEHTYRCCKFCDNQDCPDRCLDYQKPELCQYLLTEQQVIDMTTIKIPVPPQAEPKKRRNYKNQTTAAEIEAEIRRREECQQKENL